MYPYGGYPAQQTGYPAQYSQQGGYPYVPTGGQNSYASQQQPYSQQSGYPPQQQQYPGAYPQQQVYQSQQAYPQQQYPPQQPFPSQQQYPQQQYPQQQYPQQQAYLPQQGYPAAAVVTGAAPVAVASATPVVVPTAGVVLPVAGQSVFTQAMTFQVRKNYTYEVGKGEMDIYLNGMPYYRLLSNPAPSHIFGWGHNYALYDLMNNQLAYIEQEVRLGLAHFNIFVRGQKYAKLKKQFTVFNKLFHLDSEVSGEHIKIKGDWFAMSFRFERSDGKTAATVMGNYTNDMYDVTIQPGEDALMILLAVLTVEKLCRDS